MKRFELNIKNVLVVTQLEVENNKINYCITATTTSGNVIYRNINSTETVQTIESFYNNELLILINAIEFETIASSTIENIMRYNRTDWNNLRLKGSVEFREAYNKLILIAESTGQDDGEILIAEISKNVFTFSVSGWYRKAKLTWDFNLNCKADLRKAFYKNLVLA